MKVVAGCAILMATIGFVLTVARAPFGWVVLACGIGWLSGVALRRDGHP